MLLCSAMSFILPNGNSIDEEALASAMLDTDRSRRYFLDAKTGEVIRREVEKNVPVEVEDLRPPHFFEVARVSEEEQASWRVSLVTELIAPQGTREAEFFVRKAKNKKEFLGALKKDEERWDLGWEQWEQDSLYDHLEARLAALPVAIEDDWDLDDDCGLCVMLARDRKEGRAEDQFEELQRLNRDMRRLE